MNDNREENMEHVKNLWSRYLQWVAENPTLATDMETSIKWISLIATGKSIPKTKSGFSSILNFRIPKKFHKFHVMVRIGLFGIRFIQIHQ